MVPSAFIFFPLRIRLSTAPLSLLCPPLLSALLCLPLSLPCPLVWFHTHPYQHSPPLLLLVTTAATLRPSPYLSFWSRSLDAQHSPPSSISSSPSCSRLLDSPPQSLPHFALLVLVLPVPRLRHSPPSTPDAAAPLLHASCLHSLLPFCSARKQLTR